MSELSQQDRIIQIATPLGDDVLLLQSFSGTEAMSQLFRFHLDMVSTNFAIDFTQIIGENVTVAVRLPDESFRFFNGLISRFSQGQVEGHLARYQAEMVPWLWFLTRTADCRIFQDKSAPDIIEQIFQDLQFADYRLDLEGSYATREYCVQYRETDFNFVSRLMEEEGIYYYFEHEDGKHTLCLSDKKSGYATCGESPASFASVTGPGTAHFEGRVYDWHHEQEFRPGKWAATDYNFETPGTRLLTNTSSMIPLPGIGAYEIYDYPGGFMDRGAGDEVVRKRMEEEETPFDVSAGSSTCASFQPGFQFELEEYHRRDCNRGYLLTSVTHSAHSGGFIAGVPSEGSYTNSFTCIPDDVQFRPPRLTVKPMIQGPQTAVVVGPPGEEIYVDKYGRIKVQFHWDREGEYNEKSSCWMRVRQFWAGKRWGAVYTPRIGHEVVVDFLEGDPDRPLIVGSLYNAENMPHYDLPGFQTLSYIKSHSSKGGGGFNEIRFEDKKGEEQVFLHSEKRMDVRAKGSYLQTNGGERHILSGAGIFVHGKDNNDVHFDADRFEKLDGKLNMSVGGNVLCEFKADQATMVTGKAEWNAREITIEALTKISLKVGGNCIMIDPSGITIAGTMVRINSGGFAAGVAPQTIEDPYDASGADTGEPGYLSRRGTGSRPPRNSRRLPGQHYVAPPRPGESPQMTAIRDRLQHSEAGRHALEVYDRYNVQSNFTPGHAAEYDSDHNTVYLDPNSSTLPTTFVHEMGHAEPQNEGRSADVANQSREDYINTQLREDAHAESQAYQAEQELNDAGYPDNHHTVTEPVYNQAYNDAEAQARQDHPEWSEEQVREHAHQQAEDAISQEYQDGNITTGNTNPPQSYTDYWGDYWDSQHPGAGGGGTP